MNKLFLIDGTSGIWKSDLLTYVSEKLPYSKVFLKETTREKYDFEKEKQLLSDLKFVDNSEFEEDDYEYRYLYNGNNYGFSKEKLKKAIEKYENTFLIIRNQDLIKKISNDFKNIITVNVFIYTDFAIVGERLPIKNDSSLMASIVAAFKDYLRNPVLYDEIIINGSTENDFYRLMDLLVDRNNHSKTLLKAQKKANIKLFFIAISFLFLWFLTGFLILKFDWNTIEPKLALITFPLIGYSFSILYFLASKKELVLNPKKAYDYMVYNSFSKQIKELNKRKTAHNNV